MSDGVHVLRGFGRTLLFGGFAALGVPVVWLVLVPVLGGFLALGLYLVGLAAAYLAWIAGSPRRGVRAAALASIGALPLLALAPSLSLVAAGLALIVAIVRSGFLFRAPQPRMLTLEVLLGFAGLAVAGTLASPGLFGVALAIWGWFLVQSVWFLVARPRPRGPEAGGDAFERARERLERLLDQVEGGAV